MHTRETEKNALITRRITILLDCSLHILKDTFMFELKCSAAGAGPDGRTARCRWESHDCIESRCNSVRLGNNTNNINAFGYFVLLVLCYNPLYCFHCLSIVLIVFNLYNVWICIVDDSFQSCLLFSLFLYCCIVSFIVHIGSIATLQWIQ